jgi:hypothetical protein
LDEFDSLVKSITDFWLTKVKLPRPMLTDVSQIGNDPVKRAAQRLRAGK